MRVTALYRHPVKSHGREALDEVTLVAGQAMPMDRRWAVAHEAARLEDGEWARCANFSRTSKAPSLMAINAAFDDSTGQLTLTHPALPALSFDPDTDGAALIDWVRPIVPQDRALPSKVVSLPERGFTDTNFASISLCNLASHEAVSEKSDKPLSPLRWRGNIWFDGAEAWEEMNWAGRELALGDATLEVVEPILRCLATTANPETGQRDVDTLGLLEANWGHQDFGIYAVVTGGGRVAVGDSLTVR